jgi:hypothetical protein
MARMTRVLAFVPMALAASVLPLAAQDFPRRLLVQGSLRPGEQGGGEGRSGSANLLVTIVDAGGVVRFRETFCNTPTAERQERFSVVLGTNAANPLDDRFDDDMTVNVATCQSGPCTPGASHGPACGPAVLRMPMNAVGHAFRALSAAEADEAVSALSAVSAERAALADHALSADEARHAATASSADRAAEALHAASATVADRALLV